MPLIATDCEAQVELLSASIHRCLCCLGCLGSLSRLCRRRGRRGRRQRDLRGWRGGCMQLECNVPARLERRVGRNARRRVGLHTWRRVGHHGTGHQTRSVRGCRRFELGHRRLWCLRKRRCVGRRVGRLHDRRHVGRRVGRLHVMRRSDAGYRAQYDACYRALAWRYGRARCTADCCGWLCPCRSRWRRRRRARLRYRKS